MRTKISLPFDAIGLSVLDAFLVIAVQSGLNEAQKYKAALLSTATFGLPQA